MTNEPLENFDDLLADDQPPADAHESAQCELAAFKELPENFDDLITYRIIDD